MNPLWSVLNWIGLILIGGGGAALAFALLTMGSPGGNVADDLLEYSLGAIALGIGITIAGRKLQN